MEGLPHGSAPGLPRGRLARGMAMVEAVIARSFGEGARRVTAQDEALVDERDDERDEEQDDRDGVAVAVVAGELALLATMYVAIV